MPIFEKVNYQLICFLLSVDKKCIFGQFLPITKHFRFLTQFTVLQIYTVIIKIFKNPVLANFEFPKSRFWQSSASQNCHSLYSVPNLNSTFKVVKFQSGLISESQNCTNIYFWLFLGVKILFMTNFKSPKFLIKEKKVFNILQFGGKKGQFRFEVL